MRALAINDSKRPGVLSGSSGEKTPFRKKVSKKIVNNFTRDLSIMLKARMLLVESIEILARQTTHKVFRQMLGNIVSRLKSGISLTDCLRAYPHIFNHFYLNLVEVGELTGKLDEMLERVAFYLGKVADLKRKLIQALTYPALVIGVALLSVGFIMLYVIPTFAGIFKDFDSQLPLPTLIVISISNFLQAHFFHSVGIVVVLALLLKYSKSFQQVKIRLDNLILNVPLLGGLVRKNYISHFCRTLGTLLESGVPLLQALEISSKSTQNYYIQQDILNMKYFAAKGEKLTRSLQKSKVFPLMVTQMIAVGEETAELPFMLIRISEYYDKEIDGAIETLASIIEPVMIVLLGIIIGAILVSIYLPLFNMANVMPG